MKDLFLGDRVYRGGMVLKQEIADHYEISLNTLKVWLKPHIDKNPELFPSFASKREKVSPLEFNRILEIL